VNGIEKVPGPFLTFFRLGAARLKREGLTFKQVPYEIKVS
jgi:hypothetical protein